jgi:putative ABC transport system permease protein
MSLWTRVRDVFRGDGFNRELDEEFESHIEEAVARGRDADEARRAFGSPLRQREASRAVRVAGWLDGLRADVIFGWRQLKRNQVTSAAAVLSLALAMGACVSAFRLIDALLLRSLPVMNPERLYEISYNGTGLGGKPYSFDSSSYPAFRKMREAAQGEADLIAVSYAARTDLTYASDEEMEKAYRQFVSGWMFDDFGIRPALGRVLMESDDLEPGKVPVAVISYDYWDRRFGRDPKVVGRTFRIGNDIYEIVGVASKGFTGTEPGTMTDIFVPTMMDAPAIGSVNSFWLRTFVQVKPGTVPGPLQDKLQALYTAIERERSKGWTNLPKSVTEQALKTRLTLIPAAEGVSGMQRDYRSALVTLGVLVLLVLLIACVNVANLMTALASARVREMALRVSIGAGRLRLVQMVLVESLIVALFAAGLGGLFAWWSAPFVVRMINPPDNPARLILPADWRVLGFGVALIIGVTLLFGLLPALRASAVKPVNALKGGDQPHARRRMMHGMIAVQVAFCFLVVFMGGLFVSTFNHLSHVPLGFSPDRLLTLETVTRDRLPATAWEQMADQLRTAPGVESVAMAGWPLMSGTMHNNPISIHDARPSDVLGFYLATSPGWLEAMKIPLLEGRDFRVNEADPQVTIVNQSFARQFFGSENAVGQRFKTAGSKTEYEVVGVTGDAVYRNIREPILPQMYVPFRSLDKDGNLASRDDGTILVRTKNANAVALGPELRRAVQAARAGFRVSNLRTQQEIIDAQTIRERLLMMLGVFFAAVALLLAGIGLYGVLNYSVLQRQREIGIRLAVGARRGAITRLVMGSVLAMVTVGVLMGVGLGLASARYVETLIYQVKASDAGMLALPSAVILVVVLVATVPAVLRALRVDPAEILRAE